MTARGKDQEADQDREEGKGRVLGQTSEDLVHPINRPSPT